MSTSTESVQGMILFAATAAEAWTSLADSFSSQSTTRYMAIGGWLHDPNKLYLSATDYFNKNQSMSNIRVYYGLDMYGSLKL
jgi:hypothetical protein